MVEDAKAARDRRLAEALRANLKRRKAAASGLAARRAEETPAPIAKLPIAKPPAVEGDR